MINRAEVWDAEFGAAVRPVVVITREVAIPVLASVVCVAVTGTARGHVAEVELSSEHGIEEPSFANCDWLVTLRKERLSRRRGQLDPATVRRLNAALIVALGLDE